MLAQQGVGVCTVRVQQRRSVWPVRSVNGRTHTGTETERQVSRLWAEPLP